eukprot:5269732-Pyramimonas_sp.AAC.1
MALTAPELHANLHGYIDGAVAVDFLVIAKVYDFRCEQFTWEGIAALLGISMPRYFQGFPALGGREHRRQLLAACADSEAP